MSAQATTPQTMAPALRAVQRRSALLLLAWCALCLLATYYGASAAARRLRLHAAERACLERTLRTALDFERYLRAGGFNDWSQFDAARRRNPQTALTFAPSREIAYAFVTDAQGVILIHSDPAQEGTRLDSHAAALKTVTNRPVLTRLTVAMDGAARDILDIGVPVHMEHAPQGVLRAGFVLAVAVAGVPDDVDTALRAIALPIVALLGAGMLVIAWFSSGAVISALERETLAFRHSVEREVEVIGAGIVHEVKNALNGIHMNAQLMQEYSASLPADTRERLGRNISRILHEAAHTGAMLNEFLSYAKPAAFTPAATNVVALLEDVAQFFEHECRRRAISVRCTCQPALSSVRADEQLLRHGLTNLMWNAIQAIDHDGVITLRGACENGWVLLAVGDTGGGVPPEIERRIFDVFFSSKPQGAGLGLSIVQRVARVHRGEVTLDNQPGAGCTFTLRFPFQPH